MILDRIVLTVIAISAVIAVLLVAGCSSAVPDSTSGYTVRTVIPADSEIVFER